jgi:hypothetical protein
MNMYCFIDISYEVQCIGSANSLNIFLGVYEILMIKAYHNFNIGDIST